MGGRGTYRVEVPGDIEIRNAARWAHYNWDEFCNLPGADWWIGENQHTSQANVYVQYQTENLKNAVIEYLKDKEMRRK